LSLVLLLFRNLIASVTEYMDFVTLKTGQGLEEMERFKSEAPQILEQERFPVHKWESNL